MTSEQITIVHVSQTSSMHNVDNHWKFGTILVKIHEFMFSLNLQQFCINLPSRTCNGLEKNRLADNHSFVWVKQMASLLSAAKGYPLQISVYHGNLGSNKNTKQCMTAQWFFFLKKTEVKQSNPPYLDSLSFKNPTKKQFQCIIVQ